MSSLTTVTSHSGGGGGVKHKLTSDATLDSLSSNSSNTVTSKRPRHDDVSNAAFTDSSLLSSPSAHSVSSAAASPASLKSSFRAFAASLPPSCRQLMSVGIPQQILSMHAYLQHMPPFEHCVSVPGESGDTRPVDPTTLPPVQHNSSGAAAAAASPSSSSVLTSPLSAPPASSTPSAPSSFDRPTLPPVVAVSVPLPAHPQLSSFLPFLHSTLSLLLVHLSTLKLNLQLLIPPSDDSNTFGVEIQTETLAHLTAYEDIAFAALERILVYTSNRAKMASKVYKWPGIADYWSSVRELDEGMWLDGRCCVMECRESWMAVLDLLAKNEERLNDPKGDMHRGGGGYTSMAM